MINLSDHLLSLILFTPSLVALLLFLVPAAQIKAIRWTSLLGSLLTFVLSMIVWLRFLPQATGFQMVEHADWYGTVHASYSLGIDALSLVMVLLTTFLTPLAIWASFNLKDRARAYMQLFLLLETGMLGVFLSLDLLLFFVFWEIGLVPMYFIINQWGGQKRYEASLKFFLFTVGGSLGLLLAIELMGVIPGIQTYSLVELYQKWPGLAGFSFLGVDISFIKTLVFWAFVIAFGVKVPVFPLHTWLPDAHTEAPTAGSMLLAGVLLKLGAYGFMRLVLPLFPQEAHTYAWVLALLATLSVIMGALGAWGQTDFKRLVAYSSINHMGFVMLGVATAAYARGTQDAIIAMNGAVLQMVMHGLSAAGMFFMVGVIYERAHTRDLTEFGGLMALLPKYGGLLTFMSLASLGLPGMGGFIAEFLVVRGAFPVMTLATGLCAVGLFFTGAYILKALKLVLHGPLNQRWVGHLSDMTWREVLITAPLMVLLLLSGIFPAWILDLINQASKTLF
ncbi:MAG: NADH-quinone oxidoreductase subunit M [Anaerolineae bacterium]|nr:NADH-quinone oxidoreductase subunit M [Anaerolineae bacterium]